MPGDVLETEATWPDPEGLTPPEAKRLAAHARRGVAFDLGRRLQTLYAAGQDTGAAGPQVLELEERVRRLDQYASRLEAIAFHTDSPVGAQDWPLELDELEADGRTRAACRARLYCCPLSTYFVHGPILARSAVELAERLLGRGEWIAAISELTFRQMVVSNVRLTVEETAGDARPSDGSAVPAFSGKLTTSDGRTLAFAAVQIPDDPVLELSGVNRATFDLFRGGFSFDTSAGLWRFPLSRDLGEQLRQTVNDSQAIATMVLVDVLATAGVNVRKSRGSHRQLLLGGFRDLPLPQRLGDALAGGVTLSLTDIPSEARSPNEETTLIPMQYRFSSLHTEPCRAMFAETDLPFARLMETPATAPKPMSARG